MTPIELRRAALYELRVAAAGDPIAPEDDELMLAKYTALHAMLLKRKLAPWGVADDIPAWADQPMTMMLACLAARGFGAPADRIRELEEAGGLSMNGGVSQAERQLRQLIARKFVYTPLRGQYF